MTLSFRSFSETKSTNQLLLVTLFLETTALALAISGAIAAGHSPKAYFSEGGYMTILSCLQLLGGAFVSRRVFLIVKKSSNQVLNKSSFFWQTAYLGLSFLVFDDAFEIHESIDEFIHFLLNTLFAFQETEFSDMIDDIIVAGYLLFFIIYVAKQWQTIRIFKNSFVYFKIGFVLAAAMVVLDVVTNNGNIIPVFTENLEQTKLWKAWLSTLEDSLKIYAEGLSFAGIYECWKIAKSTNSRSATGQ